MPNDTIVVNIKRADSDANAANCEHITYEGYGPGGTAIIVETLTDNKNRTASSKECVYKRNGNVGTPGCVSFMFDKKGQIIIDKEEYEGDSDELMMQALDAGAEDFCRKKEDSYEIMSHSGRFQCGSYGSGGSGASHGFCRGNDDSSDICKIDR